MKRTNLSNLIDNAFDFLEKAIDQFKTDPKYSVINFCAAIELILKARLMHEHWSLIISVPQHQHPSIAKFKSGDFKSINFADLIPKIESVTGEKLPKELKDNFTQLAQHRNKMIHFYHEAHTGKKKEELIKQIAVEQCIGWSYLEKQLGNWSVIFSKYKPSIRKINRKMRGHQIYFEAIYTDKKKEIDEAKKAGTIFVNCARCKMGAAKQTQNTDYIFTHSCWVCELEEQAVKVPCSDSKCKSHLFVTHTNVEDATCPSCKNTFTQKDLKKFLESDVADFFAPSDDPAIINCGICEGQEDVITHLNHYICPECAYITDEVEFCGFCGEGAIGKDLSESNYSGCGSCEGLAGWHRND